ncbi:MAG: PD-(D/E)XK nuclease family protein, partial [Candidatus Omnitrophica bacterium]|nr:PD-(D/E)XK nuclease family protein [Candidatus Omnitrophota bacterium]
KYYQYCLAGKRMELGELLDAFRDSFDPQGFLDKAHQEERFKVGLEALSRFFHTEENSSTQPKFIEEDFSFMFDGNKITGRFDRVDEIGAEAVIIDFKTSEVKAQKVADKKVSESLQLALYALAYQNIFGKLPARVELYFLESGLIGSHKIKDEDLDTVRKKIREASAGIRKQDFEATPAYMACTYCAYSQICPSAQIR